MEKNQLIKVYGTIYRVLAVDGEDILLIDCMKRTMPKWHEAGWADGYEECSEEELSEATGIVVVDEQDMEPRARCTAHERFTVVAGILPFVDDDRIRTEAVKRASKEKGICEQTVRNYLCRYLVYLVLEYK